jgi:hypothetical protein
MTTRRSTNLDVPGGPPVPVPANVLDFFAPPPSFTITPKAILLMALMQQLRAREKAVARHERRKRRRR